MKNIILFNEYHFGDIFLCIELVRNLVKCNPHLKVSIMNTENCYYLYSNISNIHSLLEPTKYNKNNISWEDRGNDILINMWCHGGNTFKASNINILQQQKRLKLIIEEINKKHKNINLKYTELSKNKLIPNLKISKIPEKLEKQINRNKKRIFYYNVNPRSGQYNKNINHEKNISKLCNDFKEYSIIVPKKTDLNFPNLICLDKNGIEVQSNTENIAQYAQISRKCQHIIIFNCGACFPSLVDNNNKFYIIRFESSLLFNDMINRKEDKEIKKENILFKDLIPINILDVKENFGNMKQIQKTKLKKSLFLKLILLLLILSLLKLIYF